MGVCYTIGSMEIYEGWFMYFDGWKLSVKAKYSYKETVKTKFQLIIAETSP